MTKPANFYRDAIDRESTLRDRAQSYFDSHDDADKPSDPDVATMRAEIGRIYGAADAKALSNQSAYVVAGVYLGAVRRERERAATTRVLKRDAALASAVAPPAPEPTDETTSMLEREAAASRAIGERRAQAWKQPERQVEVVVSPDPRLPFPARVRPPRTREE